ncbi:spermatogenesis-associated protein [Chloropicon primus]|uniref:Spermatogenesis-associated protein n=1 Tax=Chloropicon primus TaxID=1764295 RepID=A0A5B8MI60_9CHLO|nr:spermatogenesis-associated protein [Chloropicon primus]UPQ98554.1 spermatogenesis-associated protein [Chloropicon primus]|eukprot:QDZ19345.1 spermatogenesis-associated protein [Chloropicon primus]
MTIPNDALSGKFGMKPSVPTQPLRREILKWMHSLDLSQSIRQIRRDAMNGYLVAEICSRYYPSDIQMHGFQNGLSTPVKLDNWQQLQKFFNKRDLRVPKNLIEDTLKGVQGAAATMMETLYTLLTEKSLPENAKIPTSPGPSSETGTVSITPSRSQTRAAGSGTRDGTQGSDPIRQSIQNQPSVVIDDAKVTPLS